MREFLVKQITMLAAHLTKQRGVVSAVPLLQEPADRKVLRALLEETPPETGRTAEQTASRPLSARTRPESSASSRPSRPVSRASSASSRSESSGIRGPADGLLHVVDAVEVGRAARWPHRAACALLTGSPSRTRPPQPGLTADGIDEVACTIRSALNEEAALLRDQISLLQVHPCRRAHQPATLSPPPPSHPRTRAPSQASLEQEDQFRTASTGAGGGGAWPPTEDLRRVSHRLEALVAAARRSHTVERLLTDSAARRRRASSAGAGHARLAPLPGKAAASDASTGAAAMPPRPAAGGADRGRPRGDGSGDAANGAPEAARWVGALPVHPSAPVSPICNPRPRHTATRRGSARSSRARRLREEVLEARYLV